MTKPESDILTVSFDNGSSSTDKSALLVSRKCKEQTIVLKMEVGEQADTLYHLLTEQTAKAEIKEERRSSEMKCPYRTKVIHKPENADGYGQNFAEDITEFMDCIKSECPFYFTTFAHKTVDRCSRAEKEGNG